MIWYKKVFFTFPIRSCTLKIFFAWEIETDGWKNKVFKQVLSYSHRRTENYIEKKYGERGSLYMCQCIMQETQNFPYSNEMEMFSENLEKP